MSGNDNRAPTDKAKKPAYPGMMGDGTEEQNLNQPGDASARIGQAEVEEAFGERAKDLKDRPGAKGPAGSGQK